MRIQIDGATAAGCRANPAMSVPTIEHRTPAPVTPQHLVGGLIGTLLSWVVVFGGIAVIGLWDAVVLGL